MGQWLRAIDAFFREHMFSSQHSHGGSQLPITLVSGDPVPSSGLIRYQKHRWYTYTHASKHTHTKNTNTTNKTIFNYIKTIFVDQTL